MVLLEAMYLGAPVVTSRNGGSMTLMGESDKYGQVVDKFDVDKWAEAVLRFLRDETYSKTVMDNAQKLIRDDYNWGVIAKRMVEHLKANGYDI